MGRKKAVGAEGVATGKEVTNPGPGTEVEADREDCGARPWLTELTDPQRELTGPSRARAALRTGPELGGPVPDPRRGK